MPGLDYNEDYLQTENKIKSLETYNQVKESENQILSQQQSSMEMDAAQTSTPLSQIQNESKRFQRQVKTQLDRLLDLNQLLPENRVSGYTNVQTVKLVKKQFTEALTQIQSEIPQIILDEMLKQLGCSQQQTYDISVFATGIYIPVESIDLMGWLKIKPGTTIGKLFYEGKVRDIFTGFTTTTTTINPTKQRNPYNMNLEMYNRIQNEGQSYSDVYGRDYLGLSNLPLFNFEFVTKDSLGISGNFFKVTLADRDQTSTGTTKNLVGQFIQDYFKTIKLVDKRLIFLLALELLFGTLSIQLKSGSGKIKDNLFFERLLNRILGLCFDNRSQIDVSGTAKVAPLDGVNDSFFELTDIDLLQLESKLSDIQLGVVEYQDCTNVKLPLNTEEMLNTLSEMDGIDDNDTAKLSDIFEKVINSTKGNIEWPQIDAIGLKIDSEMIKAIPKSLFFAILSPKVLLPFMTMVKALESTLGGYGNSAVDRVNDLESFMKTFKVFNVNVMSRIGAKFVKILRDIIVRDVRKLLQNVTKDLQKSQTTKKYAIISQLLESLILITRLVSDYRKCKEVISDIAAIIQFALRGQRFTLPPFLSDLAAFRTGFNDTRAFLEVIQQFQKYGVPTGPMPDGSPNKFVASIYSIIEGQERENIQNGKLAAGVPPLTVLPTGLTIPASAYGKSF